jgi:hypothetical protein
MNGVKFDQPPCISDLALDLAKTWRKTKELVCRGIFTTVPASAHPTACGVVHKWTGSDEKDGRVDTLSD